MPALWGDAAKARIRRCAQDANIGGESSLRIVSEPEAAAMYVLHYLNLNIPLIGSTFVICDCGGGTVDLISYTILAQKPVLEVEEAVPGVGALCGSTFLNRNFYWQLHRKFANVGSFDEKFKAEAMAQFENVVSAFQVLLGSTGQ